MWGREVDGWGEVAYNPDRFGKVVLIGDGEEQYACVPVEHLQDVIDALTELATAAPWSNTTASLFQDREETHP